jgi:hypothetical protein
MVRMACFWRQTEPNSAAANGTVYAFGAAPDLSAAPNLDSVTPSPSNPVVSITASTETGDIFWSRPMVPSQASETFSTWARPNLFH